MKLLFFKNSDHFFPKNYPFFKNSVFQCYTMGNTLTYVRIIACRKGKYYDLHECKRDGKLIKRGYVSYNIPKQEIQNRIDENSWRLMPLFSCTTLPMACLPCLMYSPNNIIFS